MNRKKTQKEYVDELAIKNPAVEVVGMYVDAKTPILHHCLLHDVFWDTIPSRALSGCGCKECKKDKFYQSRCRGHQSYVDEVAIVNPNIEILEQYINARTPISHRCKIDGHIWKPAPNNVLDGHGCPKCRDRFLHEQRAKTQKQYEADIYRVHPTIKVLGAYVNAEIPILHQCLIDGHIWLAKPGNMLNGKGCPRCAGNIKLTQEEYIQRLGIVNPHIMPIEQYINAHTSILHKCVIDGHVWSVTPGSILSGYGCPKCAGNAKKTHDEYVQEVSIINPDIEVAEPYTGANVSILHRCKKDGCTWSARPTNILNGTGCPFCRESRGEKQIAQWFETNKIKYVYQKKFIDCKDQKQLPFDFYLSQFNICIEYDGLQHFQPVDFAGKGESWAITQFKMVQKHDDIKTRYCHNNNISLVRIPYFANINEELEKFFIHLI